MRGAKRFLGVLAATFASAALAPSLAAASSVAGTVTAQGGGPIEGVRVCVLPSPEAFEVPCVETNGAGQYAFGDLLPGDYRVRFSGEPNNLRYVSEWYDDARYPSETDLVQLGASQAATVDAELAEGGSIAGTLSDEISEQPIAGVRACATDPQGEPMRCSVSGADGSYLLNGLPSDVYNVEYEGGNSVNYLREFYEDADTWAEATDLTVTAPAAIDGIDAELAPGAEILGRVSEVSTGAAVADVFVCAYAEAPDEYNACDLSDSAGDYTLRSLPAATYLVAFEPEYFPWGIGADQWWSGAETAAEADRLTITPPETRTGIDGQLSRPLPPQNPEPEGGTVAPPLLTPPSAPPATKNPPRKCKKGFHRKLVKGKRRCVRKHRPNRRRGKGGSRSR